MDNLTGSTVLIINKVDGRFWLSSTSNICSMLRLCILWHDFDRFTKTADLFVYKYCKNWKKVVNSRNVFGGLMEKTNPVMKKRACSGL